MTHGLKRALYFFLTCTLSVLLAGDEMYSFKIILKTKAGFQPYITGNQEKLGNWNPALIPMEQLNDSTWTIELSFPSKTRLEYKFTLGSWLNEALNEDGSKPGNQIFIVRGDTTLFHKIEKWGQEVREVPIQYTGEIEFLENVYSPQLDNYRTIRIWLPPGYDKKVNNRYPVLYMHDGQNIFAPISSLSGNEWEVDETATRLIEEGLIQEIIIVGIDNNDDRVNEYTPRLKGDLYSEFIINTVKPLIDKKYRTLKNNNAIAGASMGGLIAFHQGWKYSDVFSFAGCLSPAFLYDNREIVNRVGAQSDNYPGTYFIIYNGTEDIDRRLIPDVMKMDSILQVKKINAEFNIIKGGYHSESDWAKQSEDMLLKFFGK